MKGLNKYYKIMLTNLYPSFYISDDYIEFDYNTIYFKHYDSLESLIIAIETTLEND